MSGGLGGSVRESRVKKDTLGKRYPILFVMVLTGRIKSNRGTGSRTLCLSRVGKEREREERVRFFRKDLRVGDEIDQ